MGILENMADMLRAKRKLSGQSIEQWAETLGIAPSTLQDYLSGSGNPTLGMVEHLADKLGVDPLVLMSGDIEPEQRQTALLLLDTASFFYAGFLWIAVYFSAGAYLNSLLLRKVFAPFLPEDAFAPEESD